jgi:serine/threonine-protein kinase HipA
VTNTLVIVLEGARVGTLQMMHGGNVEVTYDDQYATSPEATPLSVSMPIVQQQWRGRVVRNWLQNLLPDNDNVLERWAAQFGVSAGQPFRLLEHVGRDVAGAVQFFDPELLDADPGGVQWLTEKQLADRFNELRADPSAWTPQMAAGLFSLAGAQAKIALRYDEPTGRWGLPYGAEATTHILKPYSGALPHEALNEHLSLTLAAEVGLNAARSRILNIGGQPVVCVERYDRFPDADHVLRVHQEDMCQALGLPPTRKYEVDGGPGIVTVVDLLRRIMGPAHFSRDVDRFLRAQAFACGTAATDAHAKNYGLLLSGNQVALTPLYDLRSAAPYFTAQKRSLDRGRISVHQAGLAMQVGGARRFDDVDGDCWRALAAAARLNEADVLAAVEEVFQVIPEAARTLGDPEHDDRTWTADEAEFVTGYTTAVTRRAKNALSALRGRGPTRRSRVRATPDRSA